MYAIRSYYARFSVRALDVTVDSTLLWVGVLLALLAAVVLAFVPRLPSGEAASYNFVKCMLYEGIKSRAKVTPASW